MPKFHDGNSRWKFFLKNDRTDFSVKARWESRHKHRPPRCPFRFPLKNRPRYHRKHEQKISFFAISSQNRFLLSPRRKRLIISNKIVKLINNGQLYKEHFSKTFPFSKKSQVLLLEKNDSRRQEVSLQLKRETQREIFSCDLEIQLVERSAFNETDLSSFTPLIRGWNPERNLNISRSKA